MAIAIWKYGPCLDHSFLFCPTCCICLVDMDIGMLWEVVWHPIRLHDRTSRPGATAWTFLLPTSIQKRNCKEAMWKDLLAEWLDLSELQIWLTCHSLWPCSESHNLAKPESDNVKIHATKREQPGSYILSCSCQERKSYILPHSPNLLYLCVWFELQNALGTNFGWKGGINIMKLN